LDISCEHIQEYITVAFSPHSSDEPFNRIFPLLTRLSQKDHAIHLVKEAHHIWESKIPNYEWKAKILLMQLLDHLHDQNIYAIPSKRRVVEQMIEMMVANKRARLELKDMSSQLKKSISYLTRVFKEITGHTPIHYFNKLRIEEAKGLLSSTNEPIHEIAAYLGFNDEFYFSRLFKKIVGISPKQYRRFL
jgi:AraC-like DNA-binding protein